MIINATVAISGNRPNIVTVLLSHPVVFALNISPNEIGSSIAASRITMNMFTTELPMSGIYQFPPTEIVIENTS